MSDKNEWDGNKAVGFMAGVQVAIDSRKLDGTEPSIAPLMKWVVDSFKARDLSGVRVGCEKLLLVIYAMPND